MAAFRIHENKHPSPMPAGRIHDRSRSAGKSQVQDKFQIKIKGLMGESGV